MTYINFDKQQLINLEFSLNRELLRTNRTGSYANTTVVGCNTRKYHGLLVCPMENIDNDNHVLLSGLDVSVIDKDSVFNLAVRKYPYIYEPKGHKYAEKFEITTIPKLTYKIGDDVITMERVLAEDDRILVKYTLVEAKSEIKLRFKPFLAFRNVHKLSRANFYVNTKYKSVENGISVKMYEHYKTLFMQFDKEIEYVHVPDWYYNVEYQEEQNRGYDYQEDLYAPGFFEASLKAGESIIFTASLNRIKPKGISQIFEYEAEKRLPRDSYISCLRNSAQQFICKRNNKSEIIAGYPWFGSWGRDTFISLPGLTLYNNDTETCKEILDTMTENITDGLFPNMGTAINSVDAPLWFFWSLQQYLLFKKDKTVLWQNYGTKMKSILEKYREGTHFNIKMHDNGLIWAGENGKALTWMDAVVAGKPVTPRIGFDVEINALWYNAVMFCLEIAKENNDTEFINSWQNLPAIIQKSFVDMFWNGHKKYLADYTTYDYKDFSVRPNQIFACSLPYSAIDNEKKEKIIEIIKKYLLTKKGIRTLSPADSNYKGIYNGTQEERDLAYHQGTVWTWLLGHFCEAYLKIYGKSGLNFVEKIFYAFEEDMTTYCIGSIPEIYDGDPPQNPKGAISQAWSVAELLRIHYMITNY